MLENNRTKKLAVLGAFAVVLALSASPIALACSFAPPPTSETTITTYILCSTASSPGKLTYSSTDTADVCSLSGGELPSHTTAVADAAVVNINFKYYGCDEWDIGKNCYGTVDFYLVSGTQPTVNDKTVCVNGTTTTIVYKDLHVPVNSNGVAVSGTLTTLGSGPYYWYVIYTGTTHYNSIGIYSKDWFGGKGTWNYGSGWSYGGGFTFGSGFGNKYDFGYSYSKSAATCEPFTTSTIPPLAPPPTVPQFPLGIALVLALTIPGLLLIKSKYASKPSSSPVSV